MILLRILFINTVDLDTNGISTFIINNAKYLVLKNYVAIAYSNNLNTELEDSLLDSGINLIKLPARKKKIFSYYRKLTKIIEKNKFDIVHVNGNSTTMALELMAAKKAHCDIRIGHAHNTKTEHPILNALMYPLFNYCVTQRFACSQEAGRWLFKEKNFSVIENGIALGKYIPNKSSREKIRSKLNLEPGDILLTNVGGFNTQKNQELLVRVINLLPIKFKLLLIGDGVLYQKIKENVLDMGLEKRVFFSGSVDNVPDFLSASDIFVMPSKFEGFPYALVEAQASGLTCFVSDIITKNVNLTNNVNFLSINNPFIWKDSLLYSNYISFDERVKDNNTTMNNIISKGYSMEENAKRLSLIYKKEVKAG